MRRGLEERGQGSLAKLYDKSELGLQHEVTRQDAAWAIRGFLVGPDTGRSPPYVVVLCGQQNISVKLVDFLSGRLAKPWGATRLPKISVLEYGTGQSVLGDEDQANMDGIMVEIDGKRPLVTNAPFSASEPQSHRCGIRLRVTRNSETVGHSTLGGLVDIDGTLYGLAVGHIFAQAGLTDTSTQSKSAPASSTLRDISRVLKKWKQSRRYSMDLDWALLEMPEPNLRDGWNLVQTISSDFHPRFIALGEPPNGNRVVIATPGCTYALHGTFAGSEAIVKIPTADAPYPVWALRMDAPWLIQPGDSGSWAFDAFTGDLLGILIAGCPELREAYIVPAYRIFDDIRTRSGRPVKPVGGFSLSGDRQEDLYALLRHRRDLEKKIAGISKTDPTEKWEILGREIEKWESQSTKVETHFQPTAKPATFGREVLGNSFPITPVQLGLQRSSWLRSIECSNSQVAEGSRRPAGLAERAFHGYACVTGQLARLMTLVGGLSPEQPLRQHDSLHQRWRDLSKLPDFDDLFHGPRSPQLMTLNAMWDCLVLGRNPSSIGNLDSLPRYGEVEISFLMDRNYDGSVYTPSTDRLPWDRFTLNEALDAMGKDLRERYTEKGYRLTQG
jgi:hypothetical protein